MSARVQAYMINVWALWMAKEPCNIWIWFPAFRAKVNDACRYCQEGLSDDDVIKRHPRSHATTTLTIISQNERR